MTSNTLDRIIELTLQGYTICFQQDITHDIMIRVSKGKDHAYHIVTEELIKQAKCDVILYCINRLVDMLNTEE